MTLNLTKRTITTFNLTLTDPHDAVTFDTLFMSLF